MYKHLQYYFFYELWDDMNGFAAGKTGGINYEYGITGYATHSLNILFV